MADDELWDPWARPEDQWTADDHRRREDLAARRAVSDAEELTTAVGVLADDEAISDALHWMQHGHGAFGHPLDEVPTPLPPDYDEDDERG